MVKMALHASLYLFLFGFVFFFHFYMRYFKELEWKKRTEIIYIEQKTLKNLIYDAVCLFLLGSAQTIEVLERNNRGAEEGKEHTSEE